MQYTYIYNYRHSYFDFCWYKVITSSWKSFYLRASVSACILSISNSFSQIARPEMHGKIDL